MTALVALTHSEHILRGTRSVGAVRIHPYPQTQRQTLDRPPPPIHHHHHCTSKPHWPVVLVQIT